MTSSYFSSVYDTFSNVTSPFISYLQNGTSYIQENLFEPIYESSSYRFTSETASQFGDSLSWTGRYLFHIGSKIIAAYENEDLFKLPSLFLGFYLVYCGASKLPNIIGGYDNLAARKNFLNKALFEANRPLTERLSYLHRAAFGSISGRNRAKLIAQAAIPALIGIYLIDPFLLKHIPNFPNFSDRFQGCLNPNTGSTISASMASKGREQYVKDVIPYYLANSQRFQEAILQDTIHPNAINFAETVLNANYTSPLVSALKSGLLSGAKTVCNWTVGLTAFSAVCDRLQPTPSLNIFSEDAHGNTVINSTRLNEACSETFKWSDTLPLDSDAAQADYLASACNYTVGHFNSTKCDELHQWISPKNGTTTRNLVKGMVVDICEKLHTGTADFCEKFTPNAALQSHANYNPLNPPSYYSTLPTLAKVINSLEAASSTKQTTLRDAFVKNCPEQLNELTKKFFNITGNFNQTTFNQGFKSLSKQAHPDKTNLELHQSLLTVNHENKDNNSITCSQTSQIFQATNLLGDIYRNTKEYPDLFNTPKPDLTLTDLAQKVWNFFQPPVAERG